MNVKLDDNGKAIEGAGNDVTINGNIAVSTGAVNPIDIKGTLSRINLALDTKYSTLNGVVINGFPVDGKTTGGVTFTGENNLWLQMVRFGLTRRMVLLTVSSPEVMLTIL